MVKVTFVMISCICILIHFFFSRKQNFKVILKRMASETHNPLRWGILCAGRISSDFCVALATLPKEDHVVTHVGARNAEQAKKFAEEFNIEKASGCYETVVMDPNVDVIYIGAFDTAHKDLSVLALTNGKPVLCEKPATVNSRELEEVLAMAKRENLFYMEAVWMRCFPIYHDMKSKLMDTKSLGEPHTLIANIGFNLDRSIILSVGIYLLTLMDIVFEGIPLLDLKACGHVDMESKRDRVIGITATFEGNKCAQLLASGVNDLPGDATIICSKGTIHVESLFCCPEKYTVQYAGQDSTEFKFPLPKAGKTTFFGNSVGLRYEAEHVRECLLKGFKQSPIISHDTSRRIMGYMDEIRKQIGSMHAL